MLTSNHLDYMGETIGTGDWPSDNFTKPVKLGYDSFSVTPNPCDNRGDFRHPNGYGFTKVTERYLSGTRRVLNWYTSPTSVHQATLTGVLAPVGPLIINKVAPSPWNRALEKLVDEVRNSEANLSTSIGEGRETLEMLQTVAQGSAKALSHVKRALKTPAGRQELKKLLLSFGKDFQLNAPRHVGSAWLAWSVGLKPLLADIENIRNHVLTDKPEFLNFHCESKASSTIVEAEGDTITDGGTTYTRMSQLKHSHRVAFGANFRVSDLHQFENWRAGLTVRPSLAWELTTLSFVVDYFYNIGQYLQLLEASIYNNGFQFVWGWSSETTLREEQCAVTEHYDAPGNSWNPRNVTTGSYSSSKVLKTKVRSVLTSLPLPVAPILTIPTASGSLLNIAALLSQILSEKK